jgi:hypothetical protein
MPEMFLPGAKHRLAQIDGGHLTGGKPRVVWHSTENDPANTFAASIAAFLDRKNFSVHLVWNPVSGVIVQTIPANRYGRGLQEFGFPTNTMGSPCIQIETVGFAAHPFTKRPMPDSGRIMDWLRSLTSGQVPVRRRETATVETWARGGHFTHAVAPDSDHTDPGRINPKKLWAAGRLPRQRAPSKYRRRGGRHSLLNREARFWATGRVGKTSTARARAIIGPPRGHQSEVWVAVIP